jgi:type I restriction enzyme R subunit
MPSGYSEDTLVQQTNADYLEQQLGWESVYAYNNENFGPGSLPRLMNGEVTV